MCVVSMVSDTWGGQHFPHGLPDFDKMNRSEFLAFKVKMETELAELKLLLKAAARYDQATGQPHCESEDKVAMLRRIAAAVGVDMDDVLKTISQKPPGKE